MLIWRKFWGGKPESILRFIIEAQVPIEETLLFERVSLERERESCSFSQKTRPVRIIGAGVRSRSTNSGGRGEGRKFMKVIRAGRRRSVIGVGAGHVSLLWAARNQTFRPINIYDV